jgi:hypothetical protein
VTVGSNTAAEGQGLVPGPPRRFAVRGSGCDRKFPDRTVVATS